MGTTTACRKSFPDKPTLYQEVTDKIIIELEAGRVPWVQPWGSAGIDASLGLPKNAATGRKYSGINILILWGAVAERGFAGQSWLTFRQALALGAHVRKGEKGTTVVYADRFIPGSERTRAEEAGEEPEGHSLSQALHGFQYRPVRGPARRGLRGRSSAPRKPHPARG
jgi:antirestriction protein ArdC